MGITNRISDSRRSPLQDRRIKKHTLAALIDRYIQNVVPSKKKHGQRQKNHLLWWKSQLGHFLLSDITPALLGEQRDKLLQGTTYRGSQRSPSTVVRYLASLSHAFTVANKEWGWMEDSPFRKITKPKEPRGRVRFLDPHERERLLEVCRSNPCIIEVNMSRCQANSKHSRKQCKNWAISGKRTCRFYGGGESTGPRTKVGKRISQKANFKHGFRSFEHSQKISYLKNLLKNSSSFIENFR